MELEPRNVAVVRPYVLDYTLGILWLLAAGVFIVDGQYLLLLAERADSLAAKLSHLRVPDFLIAVVAVISAVTVPYCVSIAFKPLTMFLLDRLVAPLARKDEKQSARADVRKRVTTVLAARLGIAVLLSPTVKALYVDQRCPLLAASLRQTGQREQFHAGAILPVSILFSGVAARLLAHFVPTIPCVVASVLIGAVFFVFGVRSSFRHIKDMYLALDYAVLMADAERVPVERNDPE